MGTRPDVVSVRPALFDVEHLLGQERRAEQQAEAG
jgi:hypothetical protein